MWTIDIFKNKISVITAFWMFRFFLRSGGTSSNGYAALAMIKVNYRLTEKIGDDCKPKTDPRNSRLEYVF